MYLTLASVLLVTSLVACNLTENDEVEEVSEAEETEDVQEDIEDADLELEESSGITFTTETTKGDEISSDIFADYDLTMINVWATWCSPCVEEMNELQEVYEGMEANQNLISVCYDADESLDLANEILDENGVTFSAIVPNDEVLTNIMMSVQCFPTTIFVDKNGEVVGDYVEGAPSTQVVETYQTIIEEYTALALDGE